MAQKRCILCGRKFRHSYKLFGRTCLAKAYDMLDIEMPSSKETTDKEEYLCNKIAKMNHKSLTSKSNKYLLTELFLTKKYLEEIGLESTNRMAECVQEQIDNIEKSFSEIKENVDISVKKAKDLSKIISDFMREYSNLKKKYADDEFDRELFEKAFETSEKVLNTLGDDYKAVFDELQIKLWKYAVTLGRQAGLIIAAETLEHSISVDGSIPEDIELIEGVDGKHNELRDNVIKAIKGNEEFNKKIDYLVKKYTSDKYKKSKHDSKNHFIIDSAHKEEPEENVKEEDDAIYFNSNYDLMMAVHAGNLSVVGTKDKEIKNRNTNGYKLQISIIDTYDFTDVKTRKDFSLKWNDKEKTFGNIMNNFGVVSYKYGILKKFLITIRLEYEHFGGN